MDVAFVIDTYNDQQNYLEDPRPHYYRSYTWIPRSRQ